MIETRFMPGAKALSALAAVLLAGCTASGGDMLASAAPEPSAPAPSASAPLAPGAFPALNSVPRAAIAQMSPAEEIAMLTRLNAELAARPTLTPAERAQFEQRRLRLLQLARTNAASVQSAIDAR